MSVRDRLRAEIKAVFDDSKRGYSQLDALLDEHSALPDFDPLIDGAMENLAIHVMCHQTAK